MAQIREVSITALCYLRHSQGDSFDFSSLTPFSGLLQQDSGVIEGPIGLATTLSDFSFSSAPPDLR